jgi:hypothetical protein
VDDSGTKDQAAVSRKARLPLLDKQVTLYGPTGQAGVFAILYVDGNNQGSIDVRFFGQMKGALKSTPFGVVLTCKADATALRDAMDALLAEWEKLGLADAGAVAVPAQEG